MKIIHTVQRASTGDIAQSFISEQDALSKLPDLERHSNFGKSTRYSISLDNGIEYKAPENVLDAFKKKLGLAQHVIYLGLQQEPFSFLEDMARRKVYPNYKTLVNGPLSLPHTKTVDFSTLFLLMYPEVPYEMFKDWCTHHYTIPSYYETKYGHDNYTFYCEVNVCYKDLWEGTFVFGLQDFNADDVSIDRLTRATYDSMKYNDLYFAYDEAQPEYYHSNGACKRIPFERDEPITKENWKFHSRLRLNEYLIEKGFKFD